jgi:hypothetical protein
MTTSTRFVNHRVAALLQQVAFTRMAPARVAQAIASERLPLHPERNSFHAKLAQAAVRPLTATERTALRNRLLRAY